MAMRFALVLLWLASTPCLAGAQPAASTPPPAAAVAGDPGQPVLLDGEEVFRLYGGASGSFSMEDRIRIAEERVREIARDPFYASGLLSAERVDNGVWIVYRSHRVGFVEDASTARQGISAERRAAEIIEAVEQAVERYRERRQPEEWTRVGGLLIAATLALAGVLYLLAAGQRRLAAWLEARGRAGLTVGGQRLGFHNAARFAAFQVRVLRLVRTLLVLLLVLVYLQTAFALLPITRGFALSVLEYLLEPLRVVWGSLLANVGNLFFIVVLIALARLLLRGLRALLVEASIGTISLPAIPRDRALPLYKILRLVVMAITVVMIYPYIPGSSSAAFQGISLFAGALFTLGASSTASNFIGGMVLVFSGGLQVGDRVKIGSVTGDVDESTLVLTRLRTPANELVTFANATVLSEGFVNYSTLARKQGVIVHTEISIGYDAPWRKVHALLIDAARRTRDVLEEPQPFVLQTALNDFHIGYRINAYTRKANAMPRILGELHQNIQDAFAEGGVEILSPAWAALRDGRVSAIPPREPENTG